MRTQVNATQRKRKKQTINKNQIKNPMQRDKTQRKSRNVSRTPCFYTKLNTLALSWPLDSLKSYLYPNLDVAQYRSSWEWGLSRMFERVGCAMRELSRSETQWVKKRISQKDVFRTKEKRGDGLGREERKMMKSGVRPISSM